MKKRLKMLFLGGIIPLVIVSFSKSLNSYPINSSGLISQSINQEVRSFFETGRLSSEDRLMFRSPPSGVIPPRENSQSWQFIVYKQGGISFWMPPGVLTDESITLNTQQGDLAFRTLASRTNDRSFMVAYAPSLTPEQLTRPQKILEAIQEKAAPSSQFKLINTRSINLLDFPGRELTFESEDEAIIFRTYLVNQKVYVIGVRYPKLAPEERQTRSFLNALQLLPNS